MAIKKLQVTPEYVAQLEAQVKELETSKKYYLSKYAECEGIIEELKLKNRQEFNELQKYKQFVESVKEYTNKIDCDSKECMGCGYDIIRNTLKQLIEGLEK